jgi:hypothetical protein
MPAHPPLLPNDAQNIEVASALHRIFYHLFEYQRSAKKLCDSVKQAGYDFTLNKVQNWLECQAVYQVHKPRPKYISRVSFSSIQVSNEVHQADTLYMPYDKIGCVAYLFILNMVDVASRYKVSVPIGSTSVKNQKGILTSSTIARAFEEIYVNSECPLVWPKLLITDKESEFKGKCKVLMKKHGVKIQKAKNKRTVGIVERYN